jgi:hypothetical protein
MPILLSWSHNAQIPNRPIRHRLANRRPTNRRSNDTPSHDRAAYPESVAVMATIGQIKYILGLSHLAPGRVEGAKLAWGDDLFDMPKQEAAILLSFLIDLRDSKKLHQSNMDPAMEERYRIIAIIRKNFSGEAVEELIRQIKEN